MNQKKTINKQLSLASDKAAIKIAGCILSMQRHIANFLNKITGGFSVRTWKWLIVCFAILWGGVSISFIVSAWSGQQSVTIHTAHISLNPVTQAKPLRKDSLALLERMYETRRAGNPETTTQKLHP